MEPLRLFEGDLLSCVSEGLYFWEAHLDRRLGEFGVFVRSGEGADGDQLVPREGARAVRLCYPGEASDRPGDGGECVSRAPRHIQPHAQPMLGRSCPIFDPQVSGIDRCDLLEELQADSAAKSVELSGSIESLSRRSDIHRPSSTALCQTKPPEALAAARWLPCDEVLAISENRR